MHEYPITEKIIRTAAERAEERGARRVVSISLVVGEYSGFIAESIQMYFDIISQGTICEGAMLEVERITPRLKCSGCGKLFERVPFSFECPACGDEGQPSEIGREFYIKEITVE